jgi:hypothetical protein
VKKLTNIVGSVDMSSLLSCKKVPRSWKCGLAILLNIEILCVVLMVVAFSSPEPITVTKLVHLPSAIADHPMECKNHTIIVEKIVQNDHFRGGEIQLEKYFSPPDGFGVDEQSFVTLDSFKPELLDQFCSRYYANSSLESDFDLLARFSRLNTRIRLDATEIEILRSIVEKPSSSDEEIAWFKYEVKNVHHFNVLFKIVDAVIEPILVARGKTSLLDIWSAGLCGNHEMRRMFRDYVLLESALFQWLRPFLLTEGRNLGWDTTCLVDFNHPEQTSDCAFGAYVSPVWFLKLSSMSQGSSNAKGFVLCAGDVHLNYLPGLLSSIRHYHNVQYPIEIVYMGDGDMSPATRDKLAANFDNLHFRNLFDYVDEGIVQVRTYYLKPFALLTSRFKEAALIDVDIGFAQSPELLFNQPSYLTERALFFNDRTIHVAGHELAQLLKLVTDFPTLYGSRTRVLNGRRTVEQESGVVVVDRLNRFSGLLGAAQLSKRFPRDFLFRPPLYISDGDKELFFIGFEMMRQKYAFSQWYAGNLGYRNDRTQVCGRMLHFTDDGQPLWWNGGFKDGEDDGVRMNNSPVMRDDEIEWFDDGGKYGEEHLPTWTHDNWVRMCLFASSRGARQLEPRHRTDALAAFHNFANSTLKE